LQLTEVSTYHPGDGMKTKHEGRSKGKFHEVKGTVKEAVGRGDEQSQLRSGRPGRKDRREDPKKIGQVKKVLGK
jgi:hypothetical protein